MWAASKFSSSQHIATATHLWQPESGLDSFGHGITKLCGQGILNQLDLRREQVNKQLAISSPQKWFE